MTEKVKPAQVWGKRAAEFYTELKNQPVQIAVVTGKTFKGTLIGVDVYDIIIQQKSGLNLLIAKGNIVYVHKAKE